MKPEFAANQDGLRVADAISAHLEYLLDLWNKPFDSAIATAYFNPGGFGLLADPLERAASVRLLVGAEPKTDLRAPRRLSHEVGPTRADGRKLEDALRDLQAEAATDRDLLGFTEENDALLERLIRWLESDAVEVRRYTRRFLHGKAFLVSTDDEGVIAGSSNFTYAGLAVNVELNLGHYQPSVVRQVRKWFDDLWVESEPYDLAALYRARFLPHNPHLIYLRMLYERYGAEIAEQAHAEGTGIRLTTFQQDGVWRAKRILSDHQGVLVADGVGLGKSFIAGELIREAVVERRQRVLLVTPATLRDGPWRRFLQEHQLGVESVSFEELTGDSQLNPAATGRGLQFGANEYAMVVVDEAHAYRNPDTQRAAVLRRLLGGSPPKQLVFLTATPVNNTLWDLYYLLGYFIQNDAAFAAAGISSLKQHFAEAVATDAEDLAPDKLFDILDAVAVRRTRHFVKRYYPHDTVTIEGVEVPISFPRPIPITVAYDLDEVLPGFFVRFAHALDCEGLTSCDHAVESDAGTLSLARYTPTRFRLDAGDGEERVQLQRELSLAGLLRSGLLKRFESSTAAFARTCRRMADSHDAFVAFLDVGLVPEPEAIGVWLAGESDAGFEEAINAAVKQGHGEPANRFNLDLLRAAVVRDAELLRVFAADAERVSRDQDPKLRALVHELAAISTEASAEAFGPTDERDRRKVLVFSYFADTVDWIKVFLDQAVESDSRLAAYRGRVAAVSGTDSVETIGRQSAVWGFAPASGQAPPGRDADLYDILVSTDVLAEGVNLQQARHIINFDLPWNPMRMVQRHGRIDRIGSKHDRVFLRTYFPDDELDALLGLETRLRTKIAQAAASIGVEDEVLPGSKTSEVVFTHTRDEIEKLRAEDASLFESGGEISSAHSGEEFRQDLRAGMLNPMLAEQVQSLAWGSGSGMVATDGSSGYVFCARVGDHPFVQFRFVRTDDPSAPSVIADTLTCLARARSEPSSVRVLPDAIRRGAYPAWQLARAAILASWRQGEDPRNLQPAIPKAMRDAADLLRRVPPPQGITQDALDVAVDAVEAPYGPRIQKMVRDALAAEGTDMERAIRLLELVRDLGLRPTPVPEPLPVIQEDDIHLVCWIALTVQASDT